MGDAQVRSVTVKLSASTAEYVAGMREAAAATKGVSVEVETLRRHSMSTAKVVEGVGRVGRGMALAFGGAFAATAKTAADFNSEMATVKTLAKANAGQLEELRKAAMHAGTAYGYTATQTAQAEEELVKAGISVKDIMGGGLKGALTLAAGGQTDVANATEIAASAMTQFGLKGKAIPHIADLLAAGADKSLGGVTDLGYALEQAGTTAHQFGLSVDETVGTLSAFAHAGLKGSIGGTTLKEMFIKLISPSKKAQSMMDQYGISVKDANGKMKSMPAIADNLHSSLSKLTPAQRNAALATIFGARAMQGANILYQQGGKGIASWIKKVNDQGFAAKQAAGKMNSLKGDLKKLHAAWDNFAIGTQGHQGFLRGAVQDATKLLNTFNKLSPAVKSAIGKGALGAAAAGGILWVASKVYSTFSKASKLAKGIGGLFSKGLKGGLGKSIPGKAVGVMEVAADVVNVNGGLKGGPGGGGVGGSPSKDEKLAKELEKNGAKLTRVEKLAKAAGKLGELGSFLTMNPAGIAGTFLGVRSGLQGIHGLGDISRAGTTQTGRSYQAVLKALNDSNVGKYAKEFNIPLKSLAAQIAREGTNSQLYKSIFGRLGKQGSNPLKDELGALPFGLFPKTHDSARAQSDLFNIASKQDKKIGFSAADMMKQVQMIGAYGKQLRTLPRQVQTKVLAPGAEVSGKQVGELAKKYHLTPKQVQTLVKLLGAEGALSAADKLGKKYHLTPKQVRTIITQTAMDRSQAEIDKLAHKYHMTPKQVRTLINAVDRTGPASRSANRNLRSVHSKTVYLTVVARAIGNAAADVGRYTFSGWADGGTVGRAATGTTVPDDGRGYRDYKPYLLAPKEEVVTDRRGQASEYRPLLKAINSRRVPKVLQGILELMGLKGLSDGGTAGLADGGMAATNAILTGRNAPAGYLQGLADGGSTAVLQAMSTRTVTGHAATAGGSYAATVDRLTAQLERSNNTNDRLVAANAQLVKAIRQLPDEAYAGVRDGAHTGLAAHEKGRQQRARSQRRNGGH